MKMSSEFLCCERCFECIGKKDTRAAKLWLNLCHAYMDDPGVFELLSEIQEFKTLETLGFITSTDFDEGTLIKVNGHMTDDYGEHSFCIKRGRHA